MQNPQSIKRTSHKVPLNFITKELAIKWEDDFKINGNEIKVISRSVTDQVLKDIWTDVIKRIKLHNWKNIKQLILKLHKCHRITDQGLKRVSNGIYSNIRGLKKLTFELSECDNLTEQGMRDFSIDITRYANPLKELHIGIIDMSTDVFKAINLTAKIHQDNLKKFTLNCSGSYIIDKDISVISSKVSRCLNSLKELTLDFSQCHQITDKSLKFLGTALRDRLKKLEILKLNFSSCDKLTDQGLKDFAFGIPSTIKALTVDFSDCKEISDNGLEAFGSIVGKSEYLKSIKLINIMFIRCNQITDQGFKALFNGIASSSDNLPKIILDLSYCYKITNSSLELIKSEITNNNKNFKKLDIFFQGCHLINSKEADAIRKQMRNLVKISL